MEQCEVELPQNLAFGDCLGWAEDYECCRLWLAKLQQQENRAYYLYRFCRWAGLTPLQLLDLKGSGGFNAERLLDRFVADNKTVINGFTNSIVWNCVNSVKSFFMHNYLDLARKSGRVDLVKKRPYRKPSKETLRKLFKACQNPRDGNLLFFSCSAIALETLSHLTWEHLEDNWEKQDVPHIAIDSKFLKGHGCGKWQGVEQHTFLTPEAKEHLLFYRDWLRLKKVPIGSKTHIFVSVEAPFDPLAPGSIGSVFEELEKRANVKFSCHDGRRYLQTCLEEINVAPNWIQKMKGRKVCGEQNPYSQPEIEKLRQKFREALPLLSFLNEESGVTKAEIKDLKEALGEEALRRQDIEKQLAESPKVSSSDLKTLQELGEILKEPGAKERFMKFLKELPSELA